jgi:7-cyano-7-deazaguanine reductase
MNPENELKLLGRSEHRLPTSPDQAALETFPNRTPGRNYRIHLSAPEFSSICPVTGQPDSAYLEILYIPAERCVETKSLKFYLASYRNHAAFNEAIVKRGSCSRKVWRSRRNSTHLRGPFSRSR